MAECKHLDQIHDVKPNTNGCEECLKMGDTWVHLRLCMTCGHVGCCDSSKNKHATKHYHSHQASDREIAGTGRGLGLVLCRRSDAGFLVTSWARRS